jgi:hypothetical protein
MVYHWAEQFGVYLKLDVCAQRNEFMIVINEPRRALDCMSGHTQEQIAKALLCCLPEWQQPIGAHDAYRFASDDLRPIIDKLTTIQPLIAEGKPKLQAFPKQMIPTPHPLVMMTTRPEWQRNKKQISLRKLWEGEIL